MEIDMTTNYKIIVSFNVHSLHRSWDWCAVTDDYDGQEDDPIGYGSTPREAVDILMEQLEDRNTKYDEWKDA
jgi:hypothetical protein